MSLFDYEDDPKINIQELVEQYERSLRKEEYVFWDQESIERLIEFYEFDGNYEQAMQAVEIGLGQFSYSASLMLKKAQLLFDIKKCQEALSFVDKAKLYDPSDHNIVLLRAEIYTYQSKYKEALEELVALEDSTDDDEIIIDVCLQKADVFEDWEKYDELFDVLKQCLEIDPTSDEALGRINYCTEIANRFEEAIAIYKTIIDKEPYCHPAWYNLAGAFAGLELYEKAIDALEYVLVIDENIEYAYLDKAEYHYLLQEYSEAIESIETYHSLTSSTENAHMLEGNCYMALEQFKKARQCYRKAIAITPSNHNAFFNIGLSHELEQEWSAALKALEKAIGINKEEFKYWKELCFTRLELANFEGAIEAAQTMIELKPKVQSGYILLAKAYSGIDDLEAAKCSLKEGIVACSSTINIEYAEVALLLEWKKDKEAFDKLPLILEEHYDARNVLFDFSKMLKLHIPLMNLLIEYDQSSDS